MNFVGPQSKEDNEGITVAFDCDGTLLNLDAAPRHEVIDLYRLYEALGCSMIVWSGGGLDYAKAVARRLGLKPSAIYAKTSGVKVDIAVDDVGIGEGPNGQCKICIKV